MKKSYLAAIIAVCLGVVGVGIYMQPQPTKDTHSALPKSAQVDAGTKSGPVPASSPTSDQQQEAGAVTKTPAKKAAKAKAAKVEVVGSSQAEIPQTKMPPPWRPGAMPKVYGGDVFPISETATFKVPTGLMVLVFEDALNTTRWNHVPADLPCAFNSGSIALLPWQIDWQQANGTVLRGWFTRCVKEVVNQGTKGEPNPQIFEKYFVADQSCDWLRNVGQV